MCSSPTCKQLANQLETKANSHLKKVGRSVSADSSLQYNLLVSLSGYQSHVVDAPSMQETFEIAPVFRRSVGVLVRRAPVLFALGALAAVPTLYYVANANGDLEDPGDDIRLLGLALSMLMLGAVNFATIAELKGQPASLLRCIRVAMENMFPLLGIGLVLGLVPLVLSYDPALLAVLILPWVLLTTVFYVATPALVAEQGGVRASLLRSAHLTRGRRWRIFVILVALGMSKIGVAAVLSQVLQDDHSATSLLAHLLLELVVEVFAAVVAGVSYVLLAHSYHSE